MMAGACQTNLRGHRRLGELTDELQVSARHNATVDVNSAGIDLMSQLNRERRHPGLNGVYRPCDRERTTHAKYDKNALVVEVVHECKQPKVVLAPLATLDLSEKSLTRALHCFVIGHRTSDHADVRIATVLEQAHHMNVWIPVQLATTISARQPRFEKTLHSPRPNQRRAAVSAELPGHGGF